MDDASGIVARIRSGDVKALGELMELHSGAMLRLASVITGSRESAKDVVQDIFMWLWSQGPRLDIKGDVRGYLWNATRNRARNAVRHDEAQTRLSDNITALTPDTQRVAYNSAPRNLDAEELVAQVYAALGELPARCQEIFLLSWRDGFTNEEIAEALGISIATVRNQIARAVQTLAASLDSGAYVKRHK